MEPSNWRLLKNVEKERNRYRDDEDSKEVSSTKPCPCKLRISPLGENSVLIQFNTRWIADLMKVSCDSLVSFRYYGEGKANGIELVEDRESKKEKKEVLYRLYPRATQQRGVKIYNKDDLLTNPKFGGRHRLGWRGWVLPQEYENLYAACENKRCIKSDCRLSDLLIVHKRSFTKEVMKLCKHLKNFQLLNKVNHPSLSSLYKEGLLYPYPLLCVYFRDGEKHQGRARLYQIVFTVLLNHNLLQYDIPIEVVARQGFGSIIPSVSDLGDGFRLDPGLLPLHCAEIVAKTLVEIDQFMSDVEIGSKLQETIRNLDGFGWKPLQTIDILIEALTITFSKHGYDIEKIQEVLENRKRIEGELPNRFKDFEEEEFLIKVNGVHFFSDVESSDQTLVEHQDETGLSGLGSDSEGELEALDDGSEFDDELEALVAKPAMSEPFIIKKAAFISGMAGINIIKVVGRAYVKKLTTGERNVKTTTPPFTLGYFELDEISKKVKAVPHFNAAPNPKNKVNLQSPPAIGEKLICTIDVTNVTTAEEGDYICRHISKCGTEEEDYPKLLILEESASKHPTGGDLVYGVVRVVGRKSYVDEFFRLLKRHLKMNKEKNQDENEIRFYSALDKLEHRFRHCLQDFHLMSRNRDLVSYVNRRIKEEQSGSDARTSSKRRIKKSTKKSTKKTSLIFNDPRKSHSNQLLKKKRVQTCEICEKPATKGSCSVCGGHLFCKNHESEDITAHASC